MQLGVVAYERFNDAKKEGKTKEELVETSQHCRELLPASPGAPAAGCRERSGRDAQPTWHTFTMMQAIWSRRWIITISQFDYFEVAGNLYDAATIRRNVAIALAHNGRLSDALLYARAALRNFESYGGRAGEDGGEDEGVDWGD